MSEEFDKLMKQGFQLMSEGEYQSALSKFDKAIKVDPKNAEAYLAKADAAVLVPKVSQEEIEALYKKAIELQPDNPFMYQSYAAFCMDVGKFNEAESAYLKAAEVDPENAPYYYSEFGVEYYKKAPVVYEQHLDEKTKEIIARKSLKYLLKSIGLDEAAAKKLLQ
ncbi:MAG: tetratricopeptide repeat protein [Methanomassiliicoccales archaeon]|nr:MAG: tetratricopeptide repeat protein [Methanomassiliicoccales archaeon]